MNILNNRPPVKYKQFLTKENNFTLLHKGVAPAFCKLIELKADSLNYYVSEDDMDELGLQILYAASFTDHNEMVLEEL